MTISNLPIYNAQSLHNVDFIQSHGVLMSLKYPHCEILQVSDNVSELLNLSLEDCLGKKISQFISHDDFQKVESYIKHTDNIPLPLKINFNNIPLDAIIHCNMDGFFILELEPINPDKITDLVRFYHDIRSIVTKIHQESTIEKMSSILVQELRKILNFERILVYKYDPDWHGVVIAEDKEEDIETYLGLHYPSTDIPKPARELYVKNWVRYIPNMDYQEAKIIFQNDSFVKKLLDLTFSVLRGIDPCHIEYMQILGVKSSMTISLLKDNQLWGLIACHGYTQKSIPYEIRQACEFIGHVVSLELLAKEDQKNYEYKLSLKNTVNQLIKSISDHNHLVEGLANQSEEFLQLTNATGGVICLENKCQCIGNAPSHKQLKDLIDWIKSNAIDQIFYTDSLAKSQYSKAKELKDVASGILAMSLANNWDDYIIWFRPEEVMEMNWAGNPYYAYYEEKKDNGEIKLRPRQSFEMWKEQVALKSFPWLNSEIEAVKDLRNAIINVILRKANEIAELVQELKKTNSELQQFAYVASHDLQEPLNQVVSYVQLLEMRYKNQLDDKAKEFIGFAVEGVTQMQQLIDDLLAYSRLGSRAKEFMPTDLNKIFQRVLNNLSIKIKESQAEINYPTFPTINCDETQMMQLWQNLITNALKFKADKLPKIDITVTEKDQYWLFSIQDNGIGMDSQFSDRIFVIFQRLHTRDKYPGTGIGLTICKRIIERHNGRIWVESELNKGSTFYFTISK